MEAAELDVPADCVGSDGGREQGAELRREGEDGVAERDALARRVARDLIEADGLDERRHERRQRKAHDTPAAQAKPEHDRDHGGGAFGFFFLKYIRKNSFQLCSGLLNTATRAPLFSRAYTSQTPPTLHSTPRPQNGTPPPPF